MSSRTIAEMDALAQEFGEASLLAQQRADTFRWLANREPQRRILTVEECLAWAHEAERFAVVFAIAASLYDEQRGEDA